LAALIAALLPLPAAAQETVPYRPIPPGGADYAMPIPPLGADGARQTPNKNLNPAATLWHLRSGWNVAALNCLGSENQPILVGYRAFLKAHARRLAAANLALEAQFRTTAGSAAAGVRARERISTQLYNYFALPPARPGFCEAARALATDYLAAPPADLGLFAASALPRLDAPLESFFAEYDQYRADSAEWDRLYGLEYGYSQPGYVAVHGLGAVR
jgi:hypothetical protein